jgi:hypothetical protein
MKKIDDKPGKNPFKVPDNYFEEVNRRIISATAGSDQEIKKSGIYRRLRPYILSAAAVTGFVILSYTASLYLTNKNSASISDELSEITFTDPFFNDIDMLTLEESAEAIKLSEGAAGIKKSEIIDYLMLENIELDDIYEEL